VTVVEVVEGYYNCQHYNTVVEWVGYFAVAELGAVDNVDFDNGEGRYLYLDYYLTRDHVSVSAGYNWPVHSAQSFLDSLADSND
jgi:hypothetical protein